MHRKSWKLYGTWCLFVAWVMATGVAWPQDVRGVRPWGGQVIVPQCWRPAQTLGSPLKLTQVTADIDIRDQMATTILLFTIQNDSKSQQMAEFVVPVPKGTVVRGFTFDGAGQESKTELLERDLARATFDAIVAKLHDPALLEFAGYNLIRTSVFPVPAEGEQKVRLVMEQLLPNDNHRIDYLLPRSQSLTSSVPWSVSARLRSSKDIATVYSPSHEIAVRMVNSKEATLSISERAQANPGAFRFSYLEKTAPLSASLMTYPSLDGNGGYFLLLAGLGQEENRAAADAPKIRREITLVLDRSGSMQGEKIEQARQAAWQVLSGLEMGEAFNIITFNDQIESFSASPVIKSAETLEQAKYFIDSIRADSGTNLHDALLTALKSPATEGCLPIVLFLTDGLATVGQTSELAIRSVVEKENPHHRRVFTFGVGFDVNTPLLDKLASTSRGFATFVTPGENVEMAVSRVFRGLAGPVFSDVQFAVRDAQNSVPSRVFDVLPGTLPDLYAGDQLIVMGRYRGQEPLDLEVTARRGDQSVRFDFTFDLSAQPAGQPFVARLWASRKIAHLVEQVRDLGADTSVVSTTDVFSHSQPAQPVAVDPRLAELTDSIVSLSKEFGILTEYTSFLAEEGIDLSDEVQVRALTQQNLVDRAMVCRSGVGSWNQEMNNAYMRDAACLNLGNRLINAHGQWVTTVSIQQCAGNTLYQRGGKWVENRLLDNIQTIQPDREVEFGSPEFLALLWKLAGEGRQDELALDGDILITVGNETILVKGLPRESSKED